MEKEFLPYDLALELKDLGFDEECFGWYNYGTLCLFREDNLLDCYAGEENRPFAPTFSQAFRFFREKYNLLGSPVPCDFNRKDTKFDFIINGNMNYRCLSYEEAELECLKKLILIVKEK